MIGHSEITRTARHEQKSGPSVYFVKTQARPGEPYPARPVDAIPYVLPVVYLSSRFDESIRTDDESEQTDLVLSGTWHPEGRRLTAVRIEEHLCALSYTEAFFCGFNTVTGEWTTNSLDGNLRLNRDWLGLDVDKWEIQFEMNVTGSGTGVAIGEVAIDARHVEDILLPGLTFYVETSLPDPGVFWIGLRGGRGVRYRDGQVEHVILSDDGSVESVVLGATYSIDPARPNWRRIEMGWELFSSGDRLSVFGGTHSTNYSIPVTVHEPVDMPRTNCDVVFGLQHASPASTGWNWGVTCHGIYDCQLCSDMPTVGRARIDGTMNITFASRPDGLVPASVLLPDFLGNLPVPNVIQADTVAADGNYWVPRCQWLTARAERLPAMGVYQYVRERVDILLQFYAGFLGYTGCGGRLGSAPGDEGKQNLGQITNRYVLWFEYTLILDVAENGDSAFEVTHSAYYVGPEHMDCLGTNNFELAYAGHTPPSPPITNICGWPFVDYMSWPNSLSVVME